MEAESPTLVPSGLLEEVGSEGGRPGLGVGTLGAEALILYSRSTSCRKWASSSPHLKVTPHTGQQAGSGRCCFFPRTSKEHTYILLATYISYTQFHNLSDLLYNIAYQEWASIRYRTWCLSSNSVISIFINIIPAVFNTQNYSISVILYDIGLWP